MLRLGYSSYQNDLLCLWGKSQEQSLARNNDKISNRKTPGQVGKLFLQHRIDQCVQLAAVYNLHEGLAAALVANHVERGCVVDLNGFA